MQFLRGLLWLVGLCRPARPLEVKVTKLHRVGEAYGINVRRLTVSEARQYALEWHGERLGQPDDPLWIGGSRLFLAKVTVYPATVVHEREMSTEIRALRVVYIDGSEEQFEFSGRGVLMYHVEPYG